MAAIQVTDVIEELHRQNQRLLAELKSSEKCVKLLQSYRKCLLSLSANCKCNPMVNDNVMITILENEYKTIFDNQEGTDDEAIPRTNEPDLMSADISTDIDADTDPQTSIGSVGCAPTEEEERVLPDMPNTHRDMAPIDELGPQSQALVFNGGPIHRPLPQSQTFYQIVINDRVRDPVLRAKGKHKMSGDRDGEREWEGKREAKRLFQCHFAECMKTFNSLRHLNNHQVLHNETSSCSSVRRGHLRLIHQETERKRRHMTSQLLDQLLDELPRLKSKPKRASNREILNEAVALIHQLESRNKVLVTLLDNETKRQELLQKTAKQALTKHRLSAHKS